jgi:hypothetical protein
MNETTYSKTQLKKSTPVELDEILIQKYSYKADGVANFSKAQKIQLILDLQKASTETQEEPAEEKPIFTEEQIASYKAHCAAIGEPDMADAVCQACKNGEGVPVGQYVYCFSIVVAKPTPSKSSKKSGATVATGTTKLGKYASYEDLVKHLTSIEPGSMTMTVNQLLVKGEMTLKEIVAECDTLRTTKFAGNNDFGGVARLKAHIQSMAKTRGWVFTVETDGKIKITGIGETASVNFAPTPAPAAEEVKAA